jgi:type IV pilus assembly protein PilB
MRSWSEAENKQALELQYGVNYLSLDSTAVWPDCLMLLGEDEIRQFKAVPVRRSGKRLMIAMVNPNDVRALDAIKSQLGMMIQPVVCTAESFERFMATKYHSLLAQTHSEDEVAQDEESVAHEEPPRRARPRQGMPVTHDAPIVLLANMILTDGIKCGAIEIRIEPHGDNTKVFNVTRSETKLARTLPAVIGASLVARFKEMATIRGGGRKGAADITIADRPYRLVVETKQSKSGEGLVLQPRPGAE